MVTPEVATQVLLKEIINTISLNHLCFSLATPKTENMFAKPQPGGKTDTRNSIGVKGNKKGLPAWFTLPKILLLMNFSRILTYCLVLQSTLL